MTFYGDLARFQKKMERKLKNIQAGVAEEIGKLAVEESPVVSGRLRGAWHIWKTPEGNQLVSSQPRDQIGVKTIAEIKRVAKQFAIGETFHIVNNVVSEEEDEGGPGIHYAGIVNRFPPTIRYGKEMPHPLHSSGFFWRIQAKLPGVVREAIRKANTP